jgi:hypothetical protein
VQLVKCFTIALLPFASSHESPLFHFINTIAVMAPPSLPKDLFLSTADLDYLDIECILLGGSAIYSSMDNTTAFKDWDGVIIVRHKRDIATLVNGNRGSLCSVLALVEEEYPNLKVPDPTHPLWTRFDGVRFVGWTANRRKKGVKILSLE